MTPFQGLFIEKSRQVFLWKDIIQNYEDNFKQHVFILKLGFPVLLMKKQRQNATTFLNYANI